MLFSISNLPLEFNCFEKFWILNIFTKIRLC